MDAFISHSSHDKAAALKLAAALEQTGLDVWIDHDDLPLGALLRPQLQQAIANCNSLLLLWSAAAAESRWVASELLSALHLERRIIPCPLDHTPLPRCLRQLVHSGANVTDPAAVERLARAVRAGASDTPLDGTPLGGTPLGGTPLGDTPLGGTPLGGLAPVWRAQEANLRQAAEQIARAQRAGLDRLLRRQLEAARAHHAAAAGLLRQAQARWPSDLTLIKLGAYQQKNAYMVNHWEALQAGQPPDDPLLRAAEAGFFKVLFIDPLDPEALDGLASVLMLEHEIEAAIFFDCRAVLLAALQGWRYQEAKVNLRQLWRQRPPHNRLEVTVYQSLQEAGAEAQASADEGDDLLRQGALRAALERYEQALVLDPGLVRAHVYRGAALQQPGLTAGQLGAWRYPGRPR